MSAVSVDRVAVAAETAWMYDAYGEEAIREIATFLLGEGHSERAAAAIIRSKHLRWAEDCEGETTAASFRRYYETSFLSGRAVIDWAREGRGIAEDDYELDDFDLRTEA